MRKTIFAVCIAFCLLSTGCGSMTSHEVETSSAVTTETATAATTDTIVGTELITKTSAETTVEITEQISTETNAEVTAEPTSFTAPETQSSTDHTAPTTEQAQELIRALNTMERLVGGGLRYDADTVCTINETTYYKVTDMDFANTNDIRCYEEKYLTQDMISERYSAIVGGSSPIYIDADDGLYMKDSSKGFYIFSDTGLNIEKSLEDGYSILAGYDYFGETETADIRIVNVNGTWKICGISFGL